MKIVRVILEEFKQLIVYGNIADMTVGVIIGTTFGKIVDMLDSLIRNILLPPLGILLADIDFSNWFIVIKKGLTETGPYSSIEHARQAGAVILNVGAFVYTMLHLLIVIIAIILLIRALNKMNKKKQFEGKKITKTCPYCYATIAIRASRCSACTSVL